MAQRRSEIADDLEREGIPGLDDSDASVEGQIAPRDWPQAATDYGVTAGEQRTDEPIAERVYREEPDVSEDGASEVGRLVAPDEGHLYLDEEKDEVALDSEEDAALSAEESAMHITENP